MRTVLAAALAVLTLAAVAIGLAPRFSGGEHVAAAPVAPIAPARPADPVATRAAPQAAPTPRLDTGTPKSDGLPPLPRSLQGTSPDGALRVDAHGNLVVDRDLRRFFDYYLAATGEEPDGLIRARILAQIQAQLPPRAAAQAEALLSRYLAYRDAGRTLEALPDDASLADRLAQITALRRQYLGPDAEAGLFGEEEAADRVALERQKLEADASLTQDQREEREEALESELPERVRKERAATIAPVQLSQEEDEMRREGATDEDIRQFRIQSSGPEAADRLAALDAQRADFQKRLADFEAQVKALQAAPLDDGARAEAIDHALARGFAPEERLHAQVLAGLVKVP